MSAEPTVAPITTAEWHALIAAGLLEDQHVQLLGGQKVVMSPEDHRHVYVIEHLARQLRSAIDEYTYFISVAHPVTLSDRDEPEPDIAVVRGRLEQVLQDGHPRASDPALVIEVARSSLMLDLNQTADRYAAAGVPRYWVVDLVNGAIVCHRLEDDGRYQVTRHDFGTPVEVASLGMTLTVPTA